MRVTTALKGGFPHLWLYPPTDWWGNIWLPMSALWKLKGSSTNPRKGPSSRLGGCMQQGDTIVRLALIVEPWLTGDNVPLQVIRAFSEPPPCYIRIVSGLLRSFC